MVGQGKDERTHIQIASVERKCSVPGNSPYTALSICWTHPLQSTYLYGISPTQRDSVML